MLTCRLLRWLDVGGKRGADALKMARTAQQVTVKWIAALRWLIGQLHLAVLYSHQYRDDLARL